MKEKSKISQLFKKESFVSFFKPSEDNLEIARARLIVIMISFAICFGIIAYRLGYLMIAGEAEEQNLSQVKTNFDKSRADIVDRHGNVLATSLITQSLYANPKVIFDAEEVTQKLKSIFPELDSAVLLAKSKSGKGFVWIKRNLTPRQQSEVYELGVPGIGFQKEEKRMYPQGALMAHVLGCTDTDNRGVSGIEKYFDEALIHEGQPLQLSLDLRIQHILHDELSKKIVEFKAKGGMGLVLDVQTGEIVSLVSMPDYDPHNLNNISKEQLFNAVTLGVYEVGSTMKILTTAMALDSGLIRMDNRYDISRPLKIGRYSIKDLHPQNIKASIPELFLHSSNIGMAKMALELGAERQKEFLKRVGLFTPAVVELPEVGAPLLPKSWPNVTAITVSYGYGISISPLQISNAIAAMINGGILRRTTLLKKGETQPDIGVRVISEETSQKMRQLLRLTVLQGTGRKANTPGYKIGGKTGTAEKNSAKGYQKTANMVSFIAAFPIAKPKYLILAMVDEPVGNKSTFGFRTAGWVVCPMIKEVITRSAPILGVAPQFEMEEISEDIEIMNTSFKKENNVSSLKKTSHVSN